jgi:hypothetical protein
VSVVLIVLSAGFFSLRSIQPSAPSREEVWKGSVAGPVGDEYRFMAGYRGAPFRDRQGRTWNPDAYFNGGESLGIANSTLFQNVADPNFIRSYREGLLFFYDIPVRSGLYELHLHFAEVHDLAEDPPSSLTRLFQVDINREPVLNVFNIWAEAGAPHAIVERVFKGVRPVSDGKIHLTFAGRTGKALLTAAEVLSSSELSRPVRIVVRTRSVTAPDGTVWNADQYATGGTLRSRPESRVEGATPYLYEGERFGNFTYRIPVAKGKYRVTLYFAETFYGTRLSWTKDPRAAGIRKFNVYANGIALLRDFDVAREAGGPGRGISKTFEDLTPNAQGQIVLEFISVDNYAEVNAIEVVETN